MNPGALTASPRAAVRRRAPGRTRFAPGNAQEPPPDPTDKRRTDAAAATASPRLGLALVVIATAHLMVVLDATIVTWRCRTSRGRWGFPAPGCLGW